MPIGYEDTDLPISRFTAPRWQDKLVNAVDRLAAAWERQATVAEESLALQKENLEVQKQLAGTSSQLEDALKDVVSARNTTKGGR